MLTFFNISKRFNVQVLSLMLALSLNCSAHINEIPYKQEEMPPACIQTENTQPDPKNESTDNQSQESVLEVDATAQTQEKSGLQEWWLFLQAFSKDKTATGAIAPSSSFLANTITDCIEKEKSAKRILEIGAGTGVFTEKIIAKLTAEDHLDVIEYSEELCDMLRQKFGHLKNVHIHCISILDWQPTEGYDFVISGLPLNAFDAEFVEKVIAIYKKMLKSNGHIAYFEYVALGTFKWFYLHLTNTEAAENFSRVLGLKEEFKKHFQFINEHIVPINLPPARVVHCTNAPIETVVS